MFQAVGGIGPKIITTLIIWGAYPTWGSLIFKPEDIAGLNTPSGPTLSPLNQNLTLNCGVTPTSLAEVNNFNCSLPAILNNVTNVYKTFSCSKVNS